MYPTTTRRAARAAVITYLIAFDHAIQEGLGTDYWNSKEGYDIEDWQEQLDVLIAIEDEAVADALAKAQTVANHFGTTPEDVRETVYRVIDEYSDLSAECLLPSARESAYLVQSVFAELDSALMSRTTAPLY